MKLKLIIVILVTCSILSACMKGTTTEKSPAVNNPASNSTHFDYSKHTDPDEKMYKTILADPTKLRDGKPVFAVQEQANDWSGMQFEGFGDKDSTWGYDVRSVDISKEDLSVIQNYNDISFNTDTKWPDKLPEGFDPESILEYNKNPGLGIRDLHEKGITGKGVGIAIIDKALLPDHEQYKDNLMYYEKIHCRDESAAMHGSAVSSIAVGKDIGVAPDAKLYYIAETHGHFSNDGYSFDASIIADSILRVLEINRYLPEDEKIRVISISRGYSERNMGYQEITNAIDKANDENIFVITTSTAQYYDFSLFGMNRDYINDPDDFNSYLPAGWIEEELYNNPSSFQNDILVPMGSRTYAGCTGASDYEIGHEGALSWAVPWCAGFYALCCQANPDITPQEFISAVKSTAVSAQIDKNGTTYPFGQIINPAAVLSKITG